MRKIMIEMDEFDLRALQTALAVASAHSRRWTKNSVDIANQFSRRAAELIEKADEMIYPPRVVSGGTGEEGPYDLYEETVRTKKVGDRLCHSVAAPGSGQVVYEITRIDATGVYARTVENTSRMLTLEDVK